MASVTVSVMEIDRTTEQWSITSGLVGIDGQPIQVDTEWRDTAVEVAHAMRAVAVGLGVPTTIVGCDCGGVHE